MTFGTARVELADARALPLADASVDLVVTSPPYWALRDYKDGDQSLDGQIGAEATPAEYIAALVDCTREWARVLKPEGSLWVNLGDKYVGGGQGGNAGGNLESPHLNKVVKAGSAVPPGFRVKSLMGLPWRYALGCVDDLGLILRAEVIWSKTNALPESVTDRARRSHEHWFHLTKEPRYYSAVDDIREPHTGPDRPAYGRTRPTMPGGTRGTNTGGLDHADTRGMGKHPLGKLPGSVWNIPTSPLVIPPHVAHARCCQGTDPGCDQGLNHFAAFPPNLIRPIVLGWSPSGICLECEQGRRPVAEVINTNAPRPGQTTALSGAHGADGREGARPSSVARIIGSACGCRHPTAPTRNALVIDPFGGTGTTATVARALGRDAISFDLSAGYLGLAEWRINDRRELCRARGRYRPPKPADPLRAAALDLLATMAGV